MDLEGIELRVNNADDTRGLIDQLAALYVRDFVDPPLNEDEFYSEERFRERVLGDYVNGPEYKMVTAWSGDKLVAFIYGCNLFANTKWWTNSESPLPESYFKEDNRRTLAIFDLLVKREWRSKGIASLLHNKMLEDRRQERVTLLSSEEQQPAYSMWKKWGYQIIGHIRPEEDGPTLDVFMRQLTKVS
jgi:ribosomal protein S18 acetylase RimI-like enzyme